MTTRITTATPARAAAAAPLTDAELKVTADLKKRWVASGQLTAADFDKRWNAMPIETRRPFLDSAGNRAWMVGNGKDDLWDRRFHQMADTTLWMQILVDQKLIKKPDAHWTEVMMVSGYSVDSGDVASRDGCANILEAAPTWGMKKDVVEAMAAMVGCTGGGVYAELFLTKPAEAVKQVRAIIATAAKSAKYRPAPKLAFLDDPKQRRAFAEALVCVKLADASRGQYGQTVSSLKKSSMATDSKLVEWKKAVKA